jgi:diguanylate cyclase
MTTKDAAHWRDKYLDLLDEQESEQKNFTLRLDVLEKALLRVSLAAEGYDDDLDRHLTSLRDSLRDHDSADTETLFKPLEAQLILSDEQRSLAIERSQSALQTMLVALRRSSSDKDQRELLKEKAKAVTGECGKIISIAGFLEQLAQLQQQVLDSVAGEAAEFDEVIDGDIIDTDNTLALNYSAVDVSNATVSARAGGQVFNQQGAESSDNFAHVSEKLFPILNDLLNYVDPPADCVVQKAIAVRQRLESGLDWKDLVPTLEDIRDLIIQAYLAADDEHKTYLLQVDDTLKQILSALGLVMDDFQGQQEAEKKFNRTITDNMDSLSLVSKSTSDVDELKGHVDSHLLALQNAINNKQLETDKITTPLSEQLAQLSKQIQAIESEANTAKRDLEEQRQKAITDSLTQLPNREAYVERAFHEFTRWQRYKHPLTLAVTDIDLFKRINDNYGHQAGDKVLQVLGKAIAKRLRDVDFIGRYGGEEFVMLLPETDEQGAFDVLDKIRKAISEIAFRFKDDPVTITLSIGLSAFRDNDNIESVFARADKQLYVAKERGRNLCLIAD